LIVNDVSVGENQPCFRMRRELLLGALETNGIPDVVLVAQRNQVPITERNRAFKICGEAQVVFILEDSDGEGNRCSKLADDLDRSICRPVVADHQFVGQPGLLLNTG
jgi:hypothetical protein